LKPITYKKSDLIKLISNKLNMNYEESKIILECVLESFKELFVRKNNSSRIEIRNFGVFNIFKTKKRTNARNPKTKEIVVIPPRKKIVFKPSKEIKNLIYNTKEK